MDRQTASAA
jgi:hypothetical protein